MASQVNCQRPINNAFVFSVFNVEGRAILNKNQAFEPKKGPKYTKGQYFTPILLKVFAKKH